MKKIIAILFIIAAIALAIFGYQQYNQKESDLEIGNVELSVQKKSNTPWILWGAGGVCLVIGIVMLSDKKQ